jgi:hypothetical protein
MKKISEVVFGVAMMVISLGAVIGMSAEPKMIETDWTPRKYNAKSSLSSSTHSVTGIGISYAVVAQGADVTISVHVTTKTLNGYVWKSSDTMTIPSGMTLNDEFNPFSKDPSIVIHGLSTSATAHVFISYGEVRRD